MRNQPVSTGPDWTILDLLKWTTAYFKSHHIDQPRVDAEVLLAHTLKLKRIDLYLRYDQPMNRRELASFKPVIKRRVQGEPVAYILGSREFWSMDLLVNQDVLIPRPETECLVEAVLRCLSLESAPKRILDLGTGSGAIALALASQLPQHRYFASDRSVKAARVARQNTVRHELDGKIDHFCSDWWRAVKSGPFFDMVVSNPPYIKSADIKALQPEIRKYEPIGALDGGEDGMESLGVIIEKAHTHLKPGGRLFLEIGFDQKEMVENIVDQSGFYEQPVTTKDYSGNDRVVEIKKKG
jgi:release factor glutamine methyltransferase